MIKLKLNRDQLQALCAFTNPMTFEVKVVNAIDFLNYSDLDMLFNIIQIGEKASKKLLYSFKNKYSITLSYSEGSSLLSHVYELKSELEPLSYEHNVALILNTELHRQITNFQRIFYGQSNRQSQLIAGNTSTGGALANLTR